MSPSHPEGQQYFGQFLSILMDRSRWRLRRPFLPDPAIPDLSARSGRQLFLAEALRFSWIAPDLNTQSTWQFEQDSIADFLILLSTEPETVRTLAPAHLSDLIGPLRRPSGTLAKTDLGSRIRCADLTAGNRSLTTCPPTAP
jgi:hypothetical protein